MSNGGADLRIVIDATAIGSGRGGDETWMAGSVAALATVADGGVEFVVLHRPNARLPVEVTSATAFRTRRVPAANGLVHYGFTLPRALASAGADLAMSVTHAALWGSTPRALLLGDISFRHLPNAYRPRTRHRLEATVPRQARAAEVVITLSEFSRRSIVEELGVDPERVRVVPCAAPPVPEIGDADRRLARQRLTDLGIRAPFVLYLGNLHPRKNVATLIEAFSQVRRRIGSDSDVQLVLAGARWWGADREREAARCAPAGSVVFAGPVSEAEKELLLVEAELLAYPSRYEGFGLPPLEAMLRGTPVVAADATAIPEVVGDAAVLVDPEDVEGLGHALERVLTNPDLRDELRRRGLARAADFRLDRVGPMLHDALLGHDPQPRNAPAP